MSNSIDINGKELLTIKDASGLVDYSRDYITRLARERKIVATQIGRKWYVDIDSLKNYQSVAKAEQEIKKRRLSDDRKQELAIKAVKEKRHATVTQQAERKVPVVALAGFIVFLGLSVGVAMEHGVRDGFVTLSQIANTRIGFESADTALELERDESVYAEPITTETLEPIFKPTATQNVLQAKHSGLMLLPDTENARVEAQDYFSDPVDVVTATSGESYLVRTNKDGEPIGELVPFVVVPVNSHSP